MVRERAGATRSHARRSNVDDAVGLVEADELRFNQVVLNLLSNAVKFTSEGGDVKVAATMTEAISWSTVADTGMGSRRRTVSASSSPSSRAGGPRRPRKARDWA